MTTIYSSETPATRLANTLSNNPNKCVLFVNYFEGQSSGQERQATLDQIVAILHQDEKLNAFFEALDDILRQETFTQEHYGPIHDIVEALYDAGIDIYDKVSALAENSKWGDSLLHLLQLKDYPVSIYNSLGSSSNPEASAIEDS